MNCSLRLMCVLAHPDDESMAAGGLLAAYAAEGIETYVVMATRGERGWYGDPEAYPGPAALGRIRAAELCAAADVLRLREVRFLDYCDGELDRAAPNEVIGKIVAALRQIRPQVVVTFDPTGFYGHPDHIAIAQFTTAALLAAADPDFLPALDDAPHRVAKLYYLAPDPDTIAAFAGAFGTLQIEVDGVERRSAGWPAWAPTTRIDAAAHWRTAWQAVACHRSQLPAYAQLAALLDAQHARLWGVQTLYRALSFVNGGREIERDLFAGLR
jgi:LmbE family N-acetylglucosaminyl deacetylase